MRQLREIEAVEDLEWLTTADIRSRCPTLDGDGSTMLSETNYATSQASYEYGLALAHL